MKNSILITLFSSLLFFSCSSDDDSSSDTNTITLATINEKVFYNGQIDTEYTMYFSYEEGTLRSISNENNTYRLDISYNNGKVSAVSNFYNNTLDEINYFTYNNNTLQNIVGEDERVIYSYSGSTIDNITLEFNNGTSWEVFSSIDYSIINSNVASKIIRQYNNSSLLYESKIGFEYNDKINPLSLLPTELNSYLSLESLDEISYNLLKERYGYTNITDTQGYLTHTYEYVVNSNNLPTSIKKYGSNNGSTLLISEMTLTYNE